MVSRTEDLQSIDARIKDTNRKSWSQYVSITAWREIANYAIAILGLIFGILGFSMANKYAGSVAIVDRMNAVDRYGQVIGVNGRFVRMLPDTASHEVIDTFISDVFGVVNSKAMMQTNATTATALAATAAVKATINGYWATHSPLHANGEWKPTGYEDHIQLTSVLKRAGARTPSDQAEYTVEWTRTRVYENGYADAPVLYTADMLLQSGFAPITGDIGGYAVTAFTFSEVR